MMNYLHAFKATFLTPLRDRKLLQLYVGSISAALGSAVLSLTINNNFAITGQADLISIIIPLLLTFSFIFTPLIYGLLYCRDSRLMRTAVLLLPIAGLLIAQFFGHHPALMGIGIATLMAGFWCTHHIAMLWLTHEKSRGYEVSLNEVVLLGGNVVGFMLAGVLITYNSNYALLLGLASMLLGVGCFITAPRLAPPNSALHYVQQIRTSLNLPTQSLFKGMRKGMVDAHNFIGPALLLLLDFTILDIGLIVALNLIIMAVISPITGKLTNEVKGREQLPGLILLCLGWLVFLLPINWVVVLIANTLRSIGNNLVGVGLQVEWYAKQNVPAMTALEGLISAGRLLVLAITLPIMLFISPYAYIITLATMNALLALHEWLNKRGKSAQA